MNIPAVSKLYPKACPRCRGDVLFSVEIEGNDLVCLQGGHRNFRLPEPPEIDRVSPDGMTSRMYVDDKLAGLTIDAWAEVNHVDWLICHGPKNGCTLASAMRDFRRRFPQREYKQKHGYPGIWIKRLH